MWALCWAERRSLDNPSSSFAASTWLEQASRWHAHLAAFTRYYMVPGYGHGNGAFNMSWDSLAALDAWVEMGTAPAAPVAVDANPESGGRQRPLCEYPTWPRYRGMGDPADADNFECAGTKSR